MKITSALLALIFVASCSHQPAPNVIATSQEVTDPHQLFAQQFAKYPVSEKDQIYKNKAKIKITSKKAKKYKTRINEAWKDATAPNFAGHYYAIDDIGCGTGCVLVFVVDWSTGVIYSSKYDSAFAFEKNSRLIVMDPFAPGYATPPSFYEFDGKNFKEVK